MAARKQPTIEPIGLKSVEINDSFWSPRLECNRDTTLKKQYIQLKQRGLKLLRNKPFAKNGPIQPHRFWDSDIAKWIEAAAYHLATDPDRALERHVDEAIRLLGRAQEKDGYLNSFYSRFAADQKFADLNGGHELYCAGHLMEAAVAYYDATGKDELLEIMCRCADKIDRTFGPKRGQLRGYPGHQEIELALVKMHRVTGNERYLKLAKYFLDERGKRPHYFRLEAERSGDVSSISHFNQPYPREPLFTYNQSHIPIRDQKDVVGHSVRALYMLAGMVDVAARTGDPSLMRAADRLWQSTTARRMYLTGGVGSTQVAERFTADFDLPNEHAYAETCASIALVFAAHRFLQVKPHVQYADVVERALYNGVLSGVSLSGDKFFYANPLAVHPTLQLAERTRGHVCDVRQPWFDCACCPPNLARLMGSLGQYVWSQSKNTVYAHLYVSSTARFDLAGSEVIVTQKSEYPWKGRIRFRIDQTNGRRWTLALRLPSWCAKPKLTVNGKAVRHGINRKDGYARLSQNWQEGDRVELDLPMPVQRIYAHPSVRHDAGRVALQRGPVVYCFEQVDNGESLNALSLPDNARFSTRFESDILGGVPVIRSTGLQDSAEDWKTSDLYRATKPRPKRIKLTAVPYYAWGNRNPGQEMLVWIRRS